MNLFTSINHNGMNAMSNAFFEAKAEAKLAAKKSAVMKRAWDIAAEFNRQSEALLDYTHTDEETGEGSHPYADDAFSLAMNAALNAVDTLFPKTSMLPSNKRDIAAAVDVILGGKCDNRWVIDVTQCEDPCDQVALERLIIAALLTLQFEEGNDFLPRYWGEILGAMGYEVVGNPDSMEFGLRRPQAGQAA